MSTAPHFEIDVDTFWDNPYPQLQKMRKKAPIAFVPQLNATLFTLRDDIRQYEKMIDVFSSYQPDGLMSVLMGENLMRKDGEPHLAERKAIFPTVSPRTVRDQWCGQFQAKCDEIIAGILPAKKADLVSAFAMPVSGEALKILTGLTNCSFIEMNEWSQAMIDGIANYAGDSAIEARCKRATLEIDAHIEERKAILLDNPDSSLLSVMLHSDLQMESVHANVKLAISGGQNESRDVIAGAIWALLTHPEQMQMVISGEVTWADVFEEYVRWISPIGMTPRRIDRQFKIGDIVLEPEDRVFLMFSSANHDEAEFEQAEQFDITRKNSKSNIAFGAGPHFCAGAAASKALVAQVALPTIFERLPNLRLKPNAKNKIGGWAFRGLLNLDVEWD